MTAHTPGPWRAELNAPTAAMPGHIICTDDDVRHPVASLWVGGGTKGKPTQVANAHLIAAAPELLEALEVAVLLMEEDGRCDCPEVENGPCALCFARAAIGKATGGAR